MPEKPYPARRGSARCSTAGSSSASGCAGSFEELDTISTETDIENDALDAAALADLQATFEKSQWADRAPIEVEREIHLVLDGQIIICKIDAVYELDGHYQIVDWKTGKAPKDEKDLEEKQLQLALYRLAYAQWKGNPRLDRIDAVFYYVADNKTIAPDAPVRRARAHRARGAHPFAPTSSTSLVEGTDPGGCAGRG